MKHIYISIVVLLALCGGLLAETPLVQPPKLYIKNKQWYNVKDFGLRGDSATDDRANWDAIATDTSVKNIYFPSGCYRIDTMKSAVNDRTFWFAAGAVIDGFAFPAHGDDSDNVITNVRIIGELACSKKIKTKYVDGFYFEALRIVYPQSHFDNQDSTGQDDHDSSYWQISFADGTKNGYVGAIRVDYSNFSTHATKGSHVAVHFDNGAINTKPHRPENIVIGAITVKNSNSRALSINRGINLRFGDVYVDSYDSTHAIEILRSNGIYIGWACIIGVGTSDNVGMGLHAQWDTNIIIGQIIVDSATHDGVMLEDCYGKVIILGARVEYAGKSGVRLLNINGAYLGSVEAHDLDTSHADASAWGLWLHNCTEIHVDRFWAVHCGQGLRLENDTNIYVVTGYADSCKWGVMQSGVLGFTFGRIDFGDDNTTNSNVDLSTGYMTIDGDTVGGHYYFEDSIRVDNQITIGLSNSLYDFHVVKAGNVVAHLQSTSADGLATLGLQNDARQYSIRVDGGSADAFRIIDETGGATRFEINTSGEITFNNHYSFPANDSTADYVLTTDGAGTVTFREAPGAAGGEANTLADTGTYNETEGFGLAGGKTGTALKVKGLIEGSNITITKSGDSALTFAAAPGSGFWAFRDSTTIVYVNDSTGDTNVFIQDTTGFRGLRVSGIIIDTLTVNHYMKVPRIYGDEVGSYKIRMWDTVAFKRRPYYAGIPMACDVDSVFITIEHIKKLISDSLPAGDGLTYWTEGDDNDTSVFIATGPNTWVGLNDNLTMQNNSIYGVYELFIQGNIYLDDDDVNSPNLVLRDEDGKTLTLVKYDGGYAVLENDEADIRFHFSNDLDDYIYFDTFSADVPMITTGGACDLVVTSSSGYVSFDTAALIVNGDTIGDFTGTNLSVTDGVLNAAGGAGLDTTEVLDILRDSISGDATVGAAGALTIAANAIESTMIGADQVNDLDINFGAGTDQVNSDDLPAHTGDVTGGTALTIAANAVESTMIGADQVNDLDINFGTGTDQVSTDDVTEGSNKYDQALPDSSEWSTAYDSSQVGLLNPADPNVDTAAWNAAGAGAGTTDSTYINDGTQYGPFVNDMYKIKEGTGVNIVREDSTTYDVFKFHATLGTSVEYGEITATTSANWAGLVSDEQGSGYWVFSDNPTFTSGITVPDNSISNEELDEGLNFIWTAQHTFQAGFSLDDDAGDSPSLIIKDGDNKSLSLKKDDDGHALFYNDEGAFWFLISGDGDDYISIDTFAADVPMISTEGECDLVINASGGDISFGDENLTTTGTLDAGATSVTGNIAVSGTVDGVDIATFAATLDEDNEVVTEAELGDTTANYLDSAEVVDTAQALDNTVLSKIRDTVMAVLDTIWFGMTIDNPDGLTKDSIMVLAVESEWAPNGITLLSVGIKTWAATTYEVVFIEFTEPGNGGSESAIETVATSSSREAEDDGTLTDADIAAGSIIVVDLPATDIDQVMVWGTFTID